MLRRFAFKPALYFFNPSCSFASQKTRAKAYINQEDAPPAYNILQALRLTKAYANCAFEETVEIHIK